MNRTICGTTGVIAIIGHPIRHSLSPVMQNAAFAACNLDFTYIPFEVAPGNLQVAVAGLRALNVRGFNVTVPHKSQVMPLLDRLDESAESAGAVNTVVNDDGCLTGFNTDGDGVLKSLADEFGFEPRGAVVAVLGAGGAARGAVASLCRAGAARVLIANRTGSTAVELANFMADRYPATRLDPLEGFVGLETELPGVDLLMNTTSHGMDAAVPPLINLARISRSAVVYDMIYSPPQTALLREAERSGVRHANGLGMLAAQGELGFTLWMKHSPPPGLMKRTLDALLAKPTTA